jgi:formate hydrogenlyase subunit 3/multisubunit Na+/H+ antiporter MnhD subunit
VKPKKKQFSRSLGVWVGTKKKLEKTNKYISLGEGVAAKSLQILFLFVCVFCFFFSMFFLFSHWDHPREFFIYCFFGGFLHKIILEDVAGRSWGGDHIYIYTYA